MITADLLIVSASIGWVIYTEIRLKKERAKLIEAQQSALDREIGFGVKDLSNAELDALLSTKLGPGAARPQLPYSGTKAKN